MNGEVAFGIEKFLHIITHTRVFNKTDISIAKSIKLRVFHLKINYTSSDFIFMDVFSSLGIRVRIPFRRIKFPFELYIMLLSSRIHVSIHQIEILFLPMVSSEIWENWHPVFRSL